ncbi:hypothetical protein GY45DRAFT_1374091 [Cubamyces sp. BRFM 1775]|nr:hypothetical protein GY45DRAFT_1374091 [Cubamyces sp. BRFM 1775]
MSYDDRMLNTYLTIKQQCYYEYHRRPDSEDPLQLPRDSGYSATLMGELKKQAEGGDDIPFRLEYALRYLSGMATDGRESPELALYYLDPIIYPHWDTDVVMDHHYITSLLETTHLEQFVRAHSLAAYAYLKKFYATEEELKTIAQHAQSHPRKDTQTDILDPLDNIIHAAKHANWVASVHDKMTPAALTVGFAFRDVAELLDVNIEEYSHFQPLRHALDRRDEELHSVESLDKYIAVRRSCYYEYHIKPDDDDKQQFAQPGFSDELMRQFERLAEAGDDVQLRLERAIRCLSGWDTDGRMCHEGALHHVEPILFPKLEHIRDEDYLSPDKLPDMTPPELSLRAHSIAAYAYVKKYYASTDELEMIARDAKYYPREDAQINILDPLDNIFCAVGRANWLASMQFVTPAALMAGFAFKSLAERLAVDVGEFKHYRPLWRALEQREKELREAECNRRKIAGFLPPDPTTCAAPGCPAKMTNLLKTAAVHPCAGPCPLDMKPSYCSLWCRSQDPKHTMICEVREEAGLPSTIVADKRTRDRLMMSMELSDPVERLEMIPCATGELHPDPRDGEVLWVLDVPSAHDPSKVEMYAMKRYKP